MNKKVKVVLAISSIALLTGCNLEVNPTGTALMTAINYEAPTRIIYSSDETYKTPNGRLINKGDYKPVWSAIQNRLGISLLEHQAAANSGSKKACDYFRDNWMIKPYADLSMGTVYDINNYSVAGSKETILDLKPYLFDKDGNARTSLDSDPLPHIAKFLEENPGVLLSITTAKHSHPDQAAIYYVPYFDGFADLEKGTIMRADYVQRLLDDNPNQLDSTTKNILGKAGSAKYTKHYEPCYVVNGNKAPGYEIYVPHVYEEDVYDAGGKIIHHAGDPIDEANPTFKITKKENVENIILQQDRSINNGEATSKTLAEQFRKYIDDRYGKPGEGGPFDKYSDLFLAYKACYDADELVALMRLVKVSPGSLFKAPAEGKEMKEMVTLMPRLCDNQRASDLYRWAGQMFGVRGLESRNGYLYISGEKNYGEFGRYGAVHDARGTDDMLYALKKMRSLYQEGLILQDFDSMTASGGPLGKFADDTLYSGGSDAYAGFMLYDYPKDLNDWNRFESSAKDKDKPCVWVTPEGKTEAQGGHKYSLRTIVSPVAKWDTDYDEKHERDTWMQFTESWASVKTSALCLNANLVKNKAKMAAAFKLIDFAYSDEGMFLLNYGPWQDGYITQKAGEAHINKEWEEEYHPELGVDYIEYQGTRYPCLTDEAKKQHREISSLQRNYIGATLPFGFKKLNAVPYQTYDEDTTKVGIDIANKAIELETNKHVLVGGDTPQQKYDYKIPFYQITPSAFFLTKGQSSAISTLLDKEALGSIFTDSGSSNFNIWDSLIMGKSVTRRGVTVTLDNYLDVVHNSWKVGKLEAYYQDAFEIMTLPIEDQ